MLLYRIYDILVVLLCWAAAYLIRFSFLLNDPDLIDTRILKWGVALVVITYFIFSHNDLYTSQRYFSWYKEMLSVFKSHFLAISSTVILLYFVAPGRLSRLMIMIYSVMVVIVSLAGRLTIKAILFHRRRKGHNLKHVMLIGCNEQILEYAAKIIESPHLGLRITGWLDSGGHAKELAIPEIDSIEEIPAFGGYNVPDAVIIGYGVSEFDKQNTGLAHFNRTTVPVWMLPDIEHTFIGYTIESFHGIPMVKFNANRLTIVQQMAKRAVDFVGSILLLIFFSPIMSIVGLAVKLSSRGPLFYGQERVTQDGRSFTMYKFRSMRIDAEDSSGAVWARKGDDRTTKVGAFIRKTSLDELPQFWNVLKGDMSLVGPRPERPVFIDKFKDEIPSYMLRHKMKSGITGWAQVNGWRGDTSLEKRIEFDLYYIQNWGFWLDIKILFLTLLRGFVNQNAY